MPGTPEPKPLLLLQCEVLAESVPAMYAVGGETDAMFQRAFDSDAAQSKRQSHPAPSFMVRRVCNGETPPPPDSVAGVVISGSSAMASDPTPWIQQTRAWLAQAFEAEVPMLGVCFGHQLLAHMLGGRVDYMPQGPEYASVELRLTDQGANDPLLHRLPARFHAQAAHYQTVLTPPPGAVVLAEGESGVHALRFGPRAWGVQFHPEFRASDQRILLEALRTKLTAAGRNVTSDVQRLTETPQARSVLPRFRELMDTRGKI